MYSASVTENPRVLRMDPSAESRGLPAPARLPPFVGLVKLHISRDPLAIRGAIAGERELAATENLLVIRMRENLPKALSVPISAIFDRLAVLHDREIDPVRESFRDIVSNGDRRLNLFCFHD